MSLMSACSPAALPYPSLLGAQFLSLNTQLVTNYSRYIQIGAYSNHGPVNVTNVSFCNVSLSYTHPGQNDHVNVQVWLPIDTWNGRLQAVGGGGWQAGLTEAAAYSLTGGIGEGYSTVSTDAGLGTAVNPQTWGLLSPGVVNLYLLQNLATVSLNDMAVIGKAITKSFYGKPPKYSYYTGCSQGGRQGYQLAQRYPDAFDGIAAAAPAINWANFLLPSPYTTMKMAQYGEYPAICEIDAITNAAIKACDGDDGVLDGIVTNFHSCNFDATSMVGTWISNCSDTGGPRQISKAALVAINSAWEGPKKRDGTPIWYGYPRDAFLTGSYGSQGVISTLCAKNGTCVRDPWEIADDWIKLFIQKNQSYSLEKMTPKEYDFIAQLSVQMYDSIIGASDPDLSAFRDRGGKLISYHGAADPLIPVSGSEHYYNASAALDPKVHDYFRLFLAPGVNHCIGGNGPYPDTTFDAMRKWVETGIAPDTLMATSVGTTPVIRRPLCPYPKKQHYNGTGDWRTGEDWYCV